MKRTPSRMSIKEMSDLMELIAAFAAERGVMFSEPAMEGIEP